MILYNLYNFDFYSFYNLEKQRNDINKVLDSMKDEREQSSGKIKDFETRMRKLSDEILNHDEQSSKLDELIELANTQEYFPLTENQLGVYY